MQRIRRERERLGLSRAEVARRAKIGATPYGLVEDGRLAPYPVWQSRIAEAVGWAGEPAALFEDDDDACH
jgi:transcriptional regulator with XRE-family HTH domain